MKNEERKRRFVAACLELSKDSPVSLEDRLLLIDQKYDELVACYSEPHRAYHNLDHLDHGLSELAEVRHLLYKPARVEVSFFGHDKKYLPGSKTNERDSADDTADFMRRLGCSEEDIKEVDYEILATCHAGLAQDGDTCFLLDVDMSILGASDEKFTMYDLGIFDEYKKLAPEDVYRRHRKAVLKVFLDRDYIFYTLYFRRKYEAAARRNLEEAIRKLAS